MSRPSGSQIIFAYTVSVAASVLAFFVALTFKHALNPSTKTGYFGSIDSSNHLMFSVQATFIAVMIFALAPFLLCLAVLRAINAQNPLWLVGQGALVGFLLGRLFAGFGSGMVCPVIAGTVGGVVYARLGRANGRLA